MPAELEKSITSRCGALTILKEMGAFFRKYETHPSSSKCRDQATKLVKEIRKVVTDKGKTPEKHVLGPVIFPKVQSIISMSNKT